MTDMAPELVRRRATFLSLPSGLILAAVIVTATVDPAPTIGQIMVYVVGVLLLASTRLCRSPVTGRRYNLLLDAPLLLAALAAWFVLVPVAIAVLLSPVILLNHV